MTSHETVSIKPDFEFKIRKGYVDPSEHKKPKAPKPVYVKVTSVIRIDPDGEHTVISNTVKGTCKPTVKLPEPDLVMKSVPRYFPDGKFKCNVELIDINKSLQVLGLTMSDILPTLTKRGSAEHRIKVAYMHTKTMTPEPTDTSINIRQRSVGAY